MAGTMKVAVIEDTLVVNVIVADKPFADEHCPGWQDVTTKPVGSRDTYDKVTKKFTPAIPPAS